MKLPTATAPDVASSALFGVLLAGLLCIWVLKDGCLHLGVDPLHRLRLRIRNWQLRARAHRLMLLAFLFRLSAELECLGFKLRCADSFLLWCHKMEMGASTPNGQAQPRGEKE